MILALGNSANPPNFVYDRLNLALTSGTPADRSTATSSLSDIRSSKADSLLRKARANETSSGQLAAIDAALKRIENGHPRTVAVCDSTLVKASDRVARSVRAVQSQRWYRISTKS